MPILVWDPAVARPEDLDDALRMIEQLGLLQQTPHPAFLALAERLLADPAYVGHWGVERMRDEARECAAGVWEPRLPAGDGMPAMRAAIRHAHALGLAAYDEARQAVLFPGGGTVTPAQKRRHDEDFEDYDRRLAQRGAVCRALLEGFTAHFGPLGFLEGDRMETSPAPRSATLSFTDSHLVTLSRPIGAGCQRLIVTVNDADPESGYFKCHVGAGVRHDPVEAIFTQVFGEGVGRPETFFFDPAIFARERLNAFPASRAERVGLPARVAQLAMPVLDLARDLRGLDAAMNDPSRFPFACTAHPLAPKNLADHIVSFGRQSCLKPLIVSRMAGSRDFEERVAALRAFVATRVNVGEADLDRLLARLRSMP
ncbi:MAG: hypothetical protein ACTHOH_17350 [Lysobacteraceae bacterium]